MTTPLKVIPRVLRVASVLLAYRLDELVDAAHLFRPLKLLRPFLRKPRMDVSRLSRGARLRLALTDLGPTFSPDGRQVAFQWSGDGPAENHDIYVKMVGSEPPLRLTTHPADDFAPAWSPDGQFIAFTRGSGITSTWDIVIVQPLGGHTMNHRSASGRGVRRRPRVYLGALNRPASLSRQRQEPAGVTTHVQQRSPGRRQSSSQSIENASED